MSDELPSRVAVLEQIARDVQAGLGDIRDELRRAHEDIGAVHSDFGSLRGELHEEMTALRGGLREEFAAHRGALREELATLRGELRTELRENIATLRGELRTELATLNGRLNLVFYRLLLSLGTGFVVVAGLLLAALRLLAHG